MRCKNFLKIHKHTGKKMWVKYLSADGCFVKTILLTMIITTMLSVSLYQGIRFYQAAHETKFHLKYQSDLFAQQHGLSISTKDLICQKTEDEPAYFFSIWVFFHEHSRITGLQGKGEGISLTPHYHFHPLHGHLDISWAITAESSLLHIASCRTRTGNL